MEDMEAVVYLLLYVAFCHTQSKKIEPYGCNTVAGI